ncbi:hypothetical protein AVEN_236221-1 [Araneus ventricosus]|uniref:Uncharacterized protein n=1 Tax=Araneus ventricosus TaxID=182803 RepID=A0A4Y2CAD8_ARAVE|nr:hypothetical protein AVEN_236221-1 [Araneus ventricosus]
MDADNYSINSSPALSTGSVEDNGKNLFNERELGGKKNCNCPKADGFPWWIRSLISESYNLGGEGIDLGGSWGRNRGFRGYRKKNASLCWVGVICVSKTSEFLVSVFYT